MKPKKRDAQRSKAAIVEAARRLFAERGISAVSIRDIAKAAGVSHGLVQQYFGTRERMIAVIIHDEVNRIGELAPQIESAGTDMMLENFRALLKSGKAGFRDYAHLIARAELEGVEPEKMLDPEIPTPAMHLASLIRNLQPRASKTSKKMDPRLVSAYINASLFAFETMSPWLMTSVGLKPEDYKSRFDEIADISAALIALAIGSPKR